jgi:Carboxypeptidase regulatory-like domain
MWKRFRRLKSVLISKRRGDSERHRGLFQLSHTGLDGAFEWYPGLASWAKFRCPFGTEFGNRVLRHGLKAGIAGTLCAVAFLFAGLAWGSVGGSISGVIKDPSGRVVTGAQVTVRQVSTGLAYKTLSNGKGYYTFPVLPVGQYELDVQATGRRLQSR